MNQSPYEVKQAQMDEAFKLVGNPTNWKLPIDKTLPLTLDQQNAVHEAVVYFTGSVPIFRDMGNGTFRVTAAGYYRTIGA